MRQPPTTLSPGCHIRKPDVEGTSPPPHGPGVARPVIRRQITWPRAIHALRRLVVSGSVRLRPCAIAPRRSCEAFGGPWTPESFNPCVEHGRRGRRALAPTSNRIRTAALIRGDASSTGGARTSRRASRGSSRPAGHRALPPPRARRPRRGRPRRVWERPSRRHLHVPGRAYPR
jgi:hypothetical protein